MNDHRMGAIFDMDTIIYVGNRKNRIFVAMDMDQIF